MGKSNYKFILDIIDNFSKFCQSYPLNTKESLEIYSKIKSFIEIDGKPNYLIKDNGKEFKNTLLKNFCKENQITFLNGLPYSPFTKCS